MNGRAILAWNLRKIRVSQGLSQEKLAADAGVDRAYFAKIERETVNAGIDVIDKLAAALSIDLEDLFVRPSLSERPPSILRGGRRVK